MKAVKVNIQHLSYDVQCFLSFFSAFVFLCFAVNNQGFAQTTVTFNYTGSVQTWTVPQCVYTISVNAKGSQGGGSKGGLGANVSGNVSVTPGQVLQIYVGGTGACPGTGWNGGGNGPSANTSANAACGGGGATDIRVAPYNLANRIIVAAGGGGMGGGDTDAQAGAGGCATGGTGASPFGVGGGGGSQSAGGSAGPPWISSGNWGQSGSLGNGGGGGSDPCYNRGPGGGGGGGYYGGGGGGSDCYANVPLGGGGGGGGSSFVPAGASCIQGNNSGNGSLTITYSPSAVAGTVSASPSTVCAGATTTISVAGSVGSIQWQISTNGGTTWSNISGATSTSFTSSQLFNNTCYRVAVDCGGTTVYSNTVCVTVNPLPVATATPSSQTLCSGETTGISLTSNITGTSFSWTITQTGVSGASAGSGSSISQTLSATGSVSGTASYSVTPVANSCTGAPIVVVVTVHPSPVVTLNAAPSVLCSGASTTLTAGGATTYSWSNGLGAGSSHTLTPLATTTYTVTGTNTYSCTASANVTVTVNPNPVVTAAASSSGICTGQTVTLQANGATTYIWNTGSSSNPITESPLASVTYTVTGTNTFGCTGTASVPVNVFPLPPANAGADQDLCIGGSATLNASGGIAYLWNTTPPQTTAQINVTPAATTTYTVTVADLNGCTASDDVVVTVYTTPPVSAGNDTNMCLGYSLSLTAAGGVDYIWNTGSTNAIINISPITTTTYTVTITDINGCSGTDDVIVTVYPLPVLTVTPQSSNICINDSIMLNATGASFYSWTPVSYLSDPTIASPVATPLTTTTYTVIGTNQFGCTETGSAVVIVEPLPILNITPPNAAICAGQSVNLTASGAATYSWTPSSGLSSTIGASVMASPMLTTTYSITGTSAGGCVSDINHVVTVLPSPQADFIADVLSGCEPLRVEFSDNSGGNIQSWLWNFDDPASGGQNTSSLPNPIHTFNSGSYSISLSIIDVNGCTDNLMLPGFINVYPNPIASFAINPSIGNMNQPTAAFIDQSINAAYWSWNFGEPASGIANTSDLQSPLHTYSSAGNYVIWLYVTSIEGCKDSTANNYTIQDSYTFWAPNAFTPNEDGLNEYFIPKGTGIDPNKFRMHIFDRWGKEIYFTDSYNNPWDGRVGNSLNIAAQGVYTWVVFTADKSGMERKYTGRVTLIP